MLFIEGDVRFLVARGRDGLWLVYDSFIGADKVENGYYGKVIVRSNIEDEQDAIETARNYEQEYKRIRNDGGGYLDSLLFY